MFLRGDALRDNQILYNFYYRKEQTDGRLNKGVNDGQFTSLLITKGKESSHIWYHAYMVGY